MLRLLKYVIGLGIAFTFVLGITGAYIIQDISKTLPSHESLARYEPPVMTRIHAGDGSLLAEYALERRLFVPVSAMPKHLIEAVVSAEDKNFFSHPGIDIFALARAVIVNLEARLNGSNRRMIGASTITQQVAKNFLLDSSYTFDRKLREALISLRIEQTFGKDRILELYLNEIFLGAGSYGVAAAALNYFGKSLSELDLAEVAYLAALPKGPNNYHPVRHRERAIERRNWVLEQMHENGYITEQEMKQAQAKEISMASRHVGANQFAAEYFTEEARREVERLYGNDQLRTGGLSVRSTLDPKLQIMARQALARGLLKFDRSHGWRGAIKKLDLSGDWEEELAKMKPLTDIHPWQLAVVTDVQEDSAKIALRPARAVKGKMQKLKEGVVPLENLTWARQSRGISENRVLLGDPVKAASDVLSPGDVVYVGPTGDGRTFHLMQLPAVDGAIVAMDPHSGRVLAMVGGFSYARSQFNRATQAKRQPGSAIKPFVYAAALDSGYTPSSVVLDAPIEIKLSNGEVWKPENYSNKYYGPSTLRRGIEFSRNVMTVRLAQDMGIDKFKALTERLGIYGNLPAVLATSLGSGETTLLQMTLAYSMLANGGKKIAPTLIDRIQDRYGRTVWRHDERSCDDCNTADWTGQPEPELLDTRQDIISSYTAYQVTSMLEGVVERGTGKALQTVGKPVAGKTGTTNDERDAWFIGYTPDLVVGAYVGFDQPKPMGKGETGGALAAPIVAEFLSNALRSKTATPFRVPAGIRLMPIDPKTGKRGIYGKDGIILEAFKPGEEPPAEMNVIAGKAVMGAADLGFGATGSNAGEATVIDGGLTTGTGGLY